MAITITNNSYIFFPYLKSSSRVKIGGIEFRPSTDLDGLDGADTGNVQEICKMLFLRNETRIALSTFTVLPIADRAKNLPDVKKLQKIRDFLGFIYAQPHKASNSLFFTSDHASMVILSTGQESIFLVEPNYNTLVVSNVVTNNFFENDDVPGLSGVFDFNYYFWVVPGCRIYPTSHEMYFNQGQDLSIDLGVLAGNKRFDYQQFLALLDLEDDTAFSERVFTSLRWFNEATRNPGKYDLSMTSLAISIESLLGIKAAEKTDRIIDAIALLLGRPERLEEWVRQFYGERSSLVHEGHSVSQLFNLSNNKQRPEYFGSMYLYGIRIYYLCLGTILAGYHLASEERLSDHFFSNEECYRDIIKIAKNKETPDEQIEKELAILINTVRWNSSVPDSSLEYKTLFSAVNAVSSYVLNKYDKSLLPDLAAELQEYIILYGQNKQLETLEVLNALFSRTQRGRPTSPEICGTLFDLIEEVWIKVSRMYLWLKYEKDRKKS
jgi:hypothetical protein